MSEKDIYYDLDAATTRLEMITQTIMALDMAMSEGSSKMGDNALSFPCGALYDISKEIGALVDQLIKIIGKEDKIA